MQTNWQLARLLLRPMVLALSLLVCCVLDLTAGIPAHRKAKKSLWAATPWESYFTGYRFGCSKLFPPWWDPEPCESHATGYTPSSQKWVTPEQQRSAGAPLARRYALPALPLLPLTDSASPGGGASSIARLSVYADAPEESPMDDAEDDILTPSTTMTVQPSPGALVAT